MLSALSLLILAPLAASRLPSVRTPRVLTTLATSRAEGLVADAKADREFATLVEAYGIAEKAFKDAVRAARKEKQPIPGRERHPIHEYWPKIQAAADRGCVPALVWLASSVQELIEDTAEIARKKIELFGRLVREHASGEARAEILGALAAQKRLIPMADLEKLFTEFARNAGDKDLSARALARFATLLDGSKATEEEKKRAAALRARILRDFEGTPTARHLAGLIFKKERLQVGMSVPDFTTQDVDEVAFKLSDYRGKVVLLDFWGFW